MTTRQLVWRALTRGELIAALSTVLVRLMVAHNSNTKTLARIEGQLMIRASLIHLQGGTDTDARYCRYLAAIARKRRLRLQKKGAQHGFTA